MGKSKEEQARREGMSYALRMVKEHGIEWTERDLKMRGAYDIPVGVPQKDLKEFIDNTKMTLMDTVLIMSCVALHDTFGFNKVRLNRFKENFNRKADCLASDYFVWQDMIDILKDECDMDFQIRNTEELFTRTMEQIEADKNKTA